MIFREELRVTPTKAAMVDGVWTATELQAVIIADTIYPAARSGGTHIEGQRFHEVHRGKITLI